MVAMQRWEKRPLVGVKPMMIFLKKPYMQRWKQALIFLIPQIFMDWDTQKNFWAERLSTNPTRSSLPRWDTAALETRLYCIIRKNILFRPVKKASSVFEENRLIIISCILRG